MTKLAPGQQATLFFVLLGLFVLVTGLTVLNLFFGIGTLGVEYQNRLFVAFILEIAAAFFALVYTGLGLRKEGGGGPSSLKVRFSLDKDVVDVTVEDLRGRTAECVVYEREERELTERRTLTIEHEKSGLPFVKLNQLPSKTEYVAIRVGVGETTLSGTFFVLEPDVELASVPISVLERGG